MKEDRIEEIRRWCDEVERRHDVGFHVSPESWSAACRELLAELEHFAWLDGRWAKWRVQLTDRGA